MRESVWHEVENSDTSAERLAIIASTHPELGAAIAVHPNAYVALLDWLAAYGDDSTRAAVAERRSEPTKPAGRADILTSDSVLNDTISVNSDVSVYATPGAVGTQTQTNSMAILSLVLAFLPTGPLCVIFGHIALAQIRHTGEQGRGLAIAAVVLGWLWIAAFVVFILTILIPFLMLIATMNSYNGSYYG